MIKYSLACDQEHGFEAWFASSEAYDKQRKRGLVVCPGCGSKKVSKALMAPNVGVRQNRKSETAERRSEPAVAAPTAAESLVVLPEKQQALLAMMRQLRQEVAKNAEYVGSNFADEARKIHHEEVPARGIYGEATFEEAKALIEDGIEAYPLPMLPEDKN